VSSRHTLHDAFVLHSRPFRNSSQIVELLTVEVGKVGVVARGVNRGKSPQSALLQPFRPLQVAWSGRGELHTLITVEPAGVAVALSGRRLLCGLYANELMVRLLHRGGPHPGIFSSYRRLIEQLSSATPEGPLLRRFEVELLEAVGFGFDLQRDSVGVAIDARQRYRYHPEEGMVPTQTLQGEQSSVAGQTLQWLRSTEQEVEQWVLREARLLLRSAIDYHIPGELQSRKLIAQYSTIH
jgi:DNA repair protein RecO (recombination protein O)